MWSGSAIDTWTINSPTVATQTIGIRVLYGNEPLTGETLYIPRDSVSTLDWEIEQFRRSVLANRTRNRLWQELQWAPRHPLPRPAEKPKKPVSPRQKFSLLGQAHRMGRG